MKVIRQIFSLFSLNVILTNAMKARYSIRQLILRLECPGSSNNDNLRSVKVSLLTQNSTRYIIFAHSTCAPSFCMSFVAMQKLCVRFSWNRKPTEYVKWNKPTANLRLDQFEVEHLRILYYWRKAYWPLAQPRTQVQTHLYCACVSLRSDLAWNQHIAWTVFARIVLPRLHCHVIRQEAEYKHRQ